MINKPFGALEEDRYENKLMQELEITRLNEDDRQESKNSRAGEISQPEKVRRQENDVLITKYIFHSAKTDNTNQYEKTKKAISKIWAYTNKVEQ